MFAPWRSYPPKFRTPCARPLQQPSNRYPDSAYAPGMVLSPTAKETRQQQFNRPILHSILRVISRRVFVGCGSSCGADRLPVESAVA